VITVSNRVDGRFVSYVLRFCERNFDSKRSGKVTFVQDLSEEVRALAVDEGLTAARSQALRLEQGDLFSVRRELLVALYVGVATLISGVGLLVKANLDRIGPAALLSGLFMASALGYAIALRARAARRERSLGEDYVLLLGALLFSAAAGYAEVQFQVFGASWSRHLLLLFVWHLGAAYYFRSRLVLSLALTAFALWVGAEVRFGTVVDPLSPRFGAGQRSLLCALVFYLGSRYHLAERTAPASGFRDVYLQFAANFGFLGALALGNDASTRWIGALILLGLALIVARFGLRERRQSFLLYAVGYSTIGLVWLEALWVGDWLGASWLGLITVAGAVLLLLNLRARLKASEA
jgi:hypothetical protein